MNKDSTAGVNRACAIQETAINLQQEPSQEPSGAQSYPVENRGGDASKETRLKASNRSKANGVSCSKSKNLEADASRALLEGYPYLVQGDSKMQDTQ